MGDKFENLKDVNIINYSEGASININSSKSKGHTKKLIPSPLKQELKQLLATNDIAGVIAQLLSFFENKDDKETMKSIIMLEARKNEIDKHEVHNLLNAQELMIERGKLKEAIMLLIDGI